MLKYVENLVTDLKNVLTGMKKHSAQWANLAVKAEDVEADIALLEKADADVDDAERNLIQKREAARNIVASKAGRLIQVQNLAMGLHANEQGTLTDYHIDLRKSHGSRPIPGKGQIISVTDDTDGIGFIITLATQPEADHYEIEKGEAPNVNDLVLAPPFPFYKTTLKTVFVDDDVKKGIRYFYRVRGINPSGAGEWSEAVNRVQ